ncbi:MAG: hypothetical protein JSW40_05480 [Candidatus Omnitrophota bacterium]|nr:MAG: hypothetical protein JSW40_05480 [Candidatus Omnitrophota bacterium]
MQRLSFIALCVIIGMVVSLACEASSGGIPIKRPSSRAPSKRPGKERDVVGEYRKALNNTEWDIEMTSMSAQGKKVEDTIVFSKGKVFSEGLVSQGFSKTNFTLTPQSTDKVIWETMQTGKDEIVFFRGEISSDLKKMSGVISFQRKGSSEDFSFVSTAKRDVAPPQEE